MKLTKSQESKMNQIINNRKSMDSDSFASEIRNLKMICNGVIIFTLKKKVAEQYKNTMLALCEKSWCITIGKNGSVKFLNEKGKMEKASDLYFI